MSYIDFVNDERLGEIAMEELTKSLFGEKLEEQNTECDYCSDTDPARDCVLPDGMERMLVFYPDGTFLGKPFVYERTIAFCPMCGRKIKNIKE